MALPSQKEDEMPKDAWNRQMTQLNPSPIMQGELSTISLADVLQLLANREGRHVVEVILDHGLGKVFLEGELLHRAEVVGDEEIEGLEALRFLLSLDAGRFEVRKPVVWPEANLAGPVQALLIEAARLVDENEAGFSFNEDVFEKTFKVEEPQKDFLEELHEKLPEVDFLLSLSPQGEILEKRGQGEAEELAGVLSYASLHLKEIGNLLGLGELQGFAVTGKRLLWAALFEEDQMIGMCGKPRKGLLWWSKKLVEVKRGRK